MWQNPRCMIFGEEFVDRINGIKDDLPTVKDYIFVGKEIPNYAEPFERLLEKSSSILPTLKLSSMTPAASILLLALQVHQNRSS